MEEELLALKWNNHQSTFLDVIKSLRDKSLFTDSTLACGGQLFPVHKLILSTCSEYFSEIFQNIPCSNPVIILKDIECKNLQFLLDYMYLGEVNVRQNELASLVNVAECLKIKGLAVPDSDAMSFLEKPTSSNGSPVQGKASYDDDVNSASELVNDIDTVQDSPPQSPLLLASIKDEPTDALNGSEILENSIFSSSTELLYDHNVKSESVREALLYPKDTDITSVAGPSGAGFLNNTWKLRKAQSSSMEPSVEQQMVRQWLAQLTRLGGWNKLTCPVCGKVCSRSDKLKLHLRVHTGERPYRCVFCPHRSRTSDDLKRHVRTHTGERPYQCPFCPYRASDPSTIRSHKKHKHTTLYKASLAQKASCPKPPSPVHDSQPMSE